MPRLTLFLATLATAAGDQIYKQCAAPAEQTIDGIAFPGADGDLVLLGGGTRYKYGVVKVYAVGVYLEDAGATLAAFAGKSAKELTTQLASDFYAAVLGTDGGPNVAKSLVLKFHRSVGADAVAGALNDALKGKVKEVAAFKEALLKLLGSSVPSGGTVTLGCAGGALTMGFGGKTSGWAFRSLKDPELCPALLDVYLGASPISGAAKDGVATGFAATFADGACTVKKAPPAEAAA